MLKHFSTYALRKLDHNQTKIVTNTVFRQHELENKRQYMQRVLDIEQDTFTPLVYGTNGGMGDDCRKFVDELSRTLVEKSNEEYSQVVTWLRIRLSMEVVRSRILCVRRSRTPFRRNFENFTEDIMLDNIECRVQ